MKNPDSIPQPMVNQAMEVAHNADPGRYPSPSNVDAQNAMRAVLAVAWDTIWADGYTEGFSDKEMSETEAELLEKHGWEPHYTMWMPGATSDQADALIEAAIVAVEAAAPEGVEMYGIGVLSPGHRREQ